MKIITLLSFVFFLTNLFVTTPTLPDSTEQLEIMKDFAPPKPDLIVFKKHTLKCDAENDLVSYRFTVKNIGYANSVESSLVYTVGLCPSTNDYGCVVVPPLAPQETFSYSVHDKFHCGCVDLLEATVDHLDENDELSETNNDYTGQLRICNTGGC